tara:strand:- start:1109 stop:2239 length:1131 start_codon:yes stop_codon:yes gene_type:complete
MAQESQKRQMALANAEAERKTQLFNQNQQTVAAAKLKQQQMLNFAEVAAKKAEAIGNPEQAAMIRANPTEYLKSVYAQQLVTANKKTDLTNQIKNYNFNKQQFIDRGGKPKDFMSFNEYQIQMGFAQAANPQLYTPALPQNTEQPNPAALRQPTAPTTANPAPANAATNQPVPVPRVGSVIPIPGSVQDIAQKTLKKKKIGRQSQKERAGLTVVQDLQRALGIVSDSDFATGIAAELTADLPLVGKQTPAGEAKFLIESALSNVGLDTLQTMRENSPTGGALGQVPIQQQKRLEQVLGSLDVGQKTEVVQDNIKRVINIYMDIIYGSPEQIQSLVDQNKISAEDAAPLMKRNDLSFDKFGNPLNAPAPTITFKKIS